MPNQQEITLEAIYEKVVDLQRDIAQLRKSLMEEPEWEGFSLKSAMRGIEGESSPYGIEDIKERFQ